MDVRLPYSRQKRYLTGMDWVVAALDRMTRRAGGFGNASQIVLELKGACCEAALRGALRSLAVEMPVLHGRPARDWNLAPYWRMPPAHACRPIRLEVHELGVAPSAREVSSALAGTVNCRFAHAREHVVFHLFHGGADEHYLVMTFDHRLFDAGGAEAFLGLVQSRQFGDCADRLSRLAGTEPAHLSAWKRKFDAGKLLVRTVRALTGAKPRILPRPAGRVRSPFRFRVVRFSPERSAAILDAAYAKSGYLLVMPYALSAAVVLLDRIFRARGIAGTDYIVSVSVDTRTPRTAEAGLFFNHVSFFFFRIDAGCVGDRPRLLWSLRQQMYEQVKSGFPQALEESSMLMRIVPLSLLGRLMLLPLRGEFASFGFAHIGKTAFTFPQFMGADVVNLFHMPMVPVPPGIGVVVNQFGNRMNAVLSYFDDMLTDAEASAFEEDAARVFAEG
jgi:hypothetical protein